MFKAFGNWIGHRTGLKKFIDLMLIEGIPGGAKWRYVWGSCLSFVFVVQLVTGVMLMTAYSPSAENAWRSVYFIQYEMDFGWFIRGLHHFGSQTMVVLLALHMLQVVIAGAHLPPREINWWLGLALMGLVLGLSLTGYLLPWDQKGYYATQVSTKIAEGVPIIGPQIKQIVLGGPEYGNATVSRFFALHVAILPGLLMVLVIAHIAVFRKHGVTHKQEDAEKKKGWFWPDQAFRDLLVCLAIFGLMVFLVVNGHGHEVPPREAADGAKPGLYEELAGKGQEGMGANLDAPADRATAYPARPEWYFLFLFQMLKYFTDDLVVVGTVVIPSAIGLLLFILPFLGSNKMGLASKIFGGVMLLLSLGAAGGLTYLAVMPKMLKPTEFALVTRILLGPAWISVILFGLAFIVGKMKPFGHAFAVLMVMMLITAAASLTCLALADDTSPWISLEDDATRELCRGLLTRIALVLIPAVAGFWLLHLAIMPVITQKVIRGIVRVLSYAVLLVGFLATGAGIYIAMNPNVTVPEQLEETKIKLQKQLQDSIDEFEKGDKTSAEEFQKAIDHAKSYQKELKAAEKSAARAIELAWTQGVPPEGGLYLLRKDPKTQFQTVFLKHCGTCHSYGELGNTDWKTTDLESHKNVTFSAPDLGGFGGEVWLHEFLKAPGSEYFYQRMGVKGKGRRARYKFGNSMVAHMKGMYLDAKFEAEEKNIDVKVAQKKVDDELGKIAGWLAKHPVGTSWKGEDKVGFDLFKGKYDCTNCHAYEGVSDRKTAIDLTGYGSRQWFIELLRNPDHEKMFGADNIMPAFRDWTGEEGELMKENYKALITLNMKQDRYKYLLDFNIKKEEHKEQFESLAKEVKERVKKLQFSQIRDIDREILIRYFSGDDRVVFGGQEITGVKKKEEE
ncbi:MAG: cytochrome bc complex cytochrome b subunit [Gemmataceae bacterium]